MGIKQLYNDNLRKLPNEYGDETVIYRYHKLRNTFSKFYRQHYELVSKFNVGLKTLLRQGLSEQELYGDLVYKFKNKM